VLSAAGIRKRLSAGFRTEFLIKTGLVLLGASINFALIARAAGPAILQAVLLISIVFFFTWWFAGKLGVDDRLRALLASAVSICGISAAIAAAGAVKAKREQLAYTASLVIIFALPSIFLLPWLAGVLGLSPAVTGAWIGGNIDTTAAVTAAGTLAGEQPLQIATIVKVTQNALLGVAAVALTAYFALKVERSADAERPSPRAFWERFPKFVLAFLAASVIATIYASTAPAASATAAIGVANDLRVWFLIFAFVSIGLEFRVSSLREAGWRPLGLSPPPLSSTWWSVWASHPCCSAHSRSDVHHRRTRVPAARSPGRGIQGLIPESQPPGSQHRVTFDPPALVRKTPRSYC